MYYDKSTYEAAIQDGNLRIEKLGYFSDSLTVVAYWAIPAITEGKKYPVIVFNRGSTVQNDGNEQRLPIDYP